MINNEFNMIAASVIFMAAYVLIIMDKIDRVLVALSGAVLLILFKILSEKKVFGEIDFNTLVLLISMMAMIMTIKRSGIFEYIAIKTVKTAKGSPVKIMFFLSILTGLLSSVLDNVTTILIVLPVVFSISEDLKLNPVPMVISQVFASNVGGTATLIGDPPNIMIGSAVGLNFMDFFLNDAPIILPLLFITSGLFILMYKKELVATDEAKAYIMNMDENKAIKDSVLLKKGLIIFLFTIAGFTLHGVLGYESSTVALVGAVVLLLISRTDPEKILHEVEWKTIFFFTGLFVLVGGLKETGVINLLAEWTLDVTKGSSSLATISILWISAIASAFVDNIPFVATMIPLIKSMGAISGLDLTPMWWALSLGACLGGNGTIIGASANVIAVGMSEEFGHKISFYQYFKTAFPVMIVTIIITNIYILLRYL